MWKPFAGKLSKAQRKLEKAAVKAAKVAAKATKKAKKAKKVQTAATTTSKNRFDEIQMRRQIAVSARASRTTQRLVPFPALVARRRNASSMGVGRASSDPIAFPTLPSDWSGGGLDGVGAVSHEPRFPLPPPSPFEETFNGGIPASLSVALHGTAFGAGTGVDTGMFMKPMPMYSGGSGQRGGGGKRTPVIQLYESERIKRDQWEKSRHTALQFELGGVASETSVPMWYHEHSSRSIAEDALGAARPGSYLVRKATGCMSGGGGRGQEQPMLAHVYSLSVRVPTDARWADITVKHYRIEQHPASGEFELANGASHQQPVFRTIHALITYYSTCPPSDTDGVLLTFPCQSTATDNAGYTQLVPSLPNKEALAQAQRVSDMEHARRSTASTSSNSPATAAAAANLAAMCGRASPTAAEAPGYTSVVEGLCEASAGGGYSTGVVERAIRARANFLGVDASSLAEADLASTSLGVEGWAAADATGEWVQEMATISFERVLGSSSSSSSSRRNPCSDSSGRPLLGCQSAARSSVAHQQPSSLCASSANRISSFSSAASDGGGEADDENEEGDGKTSSSFYINAIDSAAAEACVVDPLPTATAAAAVTIASETAVPQATRKTTAAATRKSTKATVRRRRRRVLPSIPAPHAGAGAGATLEKTPPQSPGSGDKGVAMAITPPVALSKKPSNGVQYLSKGVQSVGEQHQSVQRAVSG